MRVRLTTSIFSFQTYDLKTDEQGLAFFQSEKMILELPFGRIRRFDLEGGGHGPQHFVLTTDERSFEGCFLEGGSAESVIRTLKNKCSCYINVQLSMEERSY